MPDFGFVGDAYAAPAAQQDAQELINWYPEVDPRKGEGSRGAVALYPTPGTRRCINMQTAGLNAGGLGPVRALFALPGASTFAAASVALATVPNSTPAVLAVIGNTVWILFTPLLDAPLVNGYVLAGVKLATTTGPCTITSNGLQAMITDGVNRYACDFNGSPLTLTLLTDGAWAGGVRCDIVDNIMIYNKPNSKQWGATNALSTVSAALSFASTFASYDNLQCVFTDQGQVAAIGTQTTEFWSNAGLFPFPFARIPGTIRQFGTAAPYSVARFGRGFAMLGQSQLGQAIVFHVQNYEFKRISTHAIEQDLIGQTISDAFGFAYQLEGHEFYVLNFPTANRTWVYDLNTGMWHKRESYQPYNPLDVETKIGRWIVNCTCVVNGQVLAGGYDGNIYTLDNSLGYEEIAYYGLVVQQVVRRVRRAPHITADFKRITYEDLQIQFQQGTGAAVDPAFNSVAGGTVTVGATDPQAMLRWSDDGGMTWGNVHPRSLGKIGKYKARTRWTRLGTARDRVFELTCTDPVYNVVISADLRATVQGR
jgi:hypothetical protein